MSYYENSRKTFAAGAAIAHQSVVKLGAAGVEACGADGTPYFFSRQERKTWTAYRQAMYPLTLNM